MKRKKNAKPNLSKGEQKTLEELAKKGHYYNQCRQRQCCSNNGCVENRELSDKHNCKMLPNFAIQ